MVWQAPGAEYGVGVRRERGTWWGGPHIEWAVWGWDRELIKCFRGRLRGGLR